VGNAAVLAIVLPLSYGIKQGMKKSHPLLLVACVAALAASLPAPVFAALEVGPKIKLKAGQTLRGSFVHEHLVKGFDAPLRTSGTYTITPGDMITWEIEKPMATSTMITSKGLSQTIGNLPLLQIKPAQVPFLADLEKNLLWALDGEWDKLKPDFTITTKGTDQAWEVTITPKPKANAPKPFQKIVAHGGQYVEAADFVTQSGATDHVTFSDPFITP